MQRLGGLDSAFLYFETPTMHMHVGGLMLLDPATMQQPYSYDRFRDYFAARLGRMPAFRRKLAPVPLNLARPYWIEDPDFDLDFHLHCVTVPAPGDDEATGRLTGDILSMPLDRSRALWEMYVVEGRADGLIGVVSKVHHSLIDGVTGANLMAELFDLTPEVPPFDQEVDNWEPERKPHDVEMLARGLWEFTKRPIGVVRLTPSTLLGVGKLLSRRRTGVPGMPAPFTAPRTPFNATVSARREVAFTHVPLDEIKEVKNAFGVKVNDVVTAVVSTALRRYLGDRDELPDRSLIAAIPVSVHDRTSDKEGTTKVSFMFSSLASDVEDPAERLRRIAETNEGAKADHDLVGASMLQDWAEHAAPNTFSLAARIYSQLRIADRHPVVHNLVLSNVPGPPIPLYLNGARLVALHPLGPVMDGAGLNITVLSNQDVMGFGFIADRALMPDLWDLARDVRPALDELLEAARRQPAAPSGRGGKRTRTAKKNGAKAAASAG